MVNLDISKDGFISGRQLEAILDALVEELATSLAKMRKDINKQNKEIKKLRKELDAERRYRLGKRF